ncbi:hypothetical protein C4D60_Mb05t04750 [Musa balbisiana]|uniref:Uncharacterized protein n=1 Tax=Musa balbisiana TaxID=52838 RepID=A0A4S8JTP8_MUSBA|nr:hypothetical protein C4D60_Mb05t04750 [Musa balbisiana]
MPYRWMWIRSWGVDGAFIVASPSSPHQSDGQCYELSCSSFWKRRMSTDDFRADAGCTARLGLTLARCGPADDIIAFHKRNLWLYNRISYPISNQFYLSTKCYAYNISIDLLPHWHC